jgi:hypothetical protein
VPGRLQLRRIAGAQHLYGGHRVFAGDLELAHVADVEETGALTDGKMLLRDAGVLDGHVPAAEGDHLCARRAMAGVERGLLERWEGLVHRDGRANVDPARYYAEWGRSTSLNSTLVSTLEIIEA